MEASRTSIGWRAGMSWPIFLREACIWRMQPGLEVTSIRAPVARTFFALRSPEVAGVVVGDGDRQRVPLCHGLEFGKKLRDVLDLLGEGFGPTSVLGVVAQEVAVLLHRRAAAGGVDDHGVEVLLLEGVYGLPREVQRLLLAPGVGA